MGKELAVLVTLLVGALVALQAPANSVLGRSIGTFAASSANFAVGTAILVGILGLEPRPVSLSRVAGVALLVAGTILVVRD